MSPIYGAAGTLSLEALTDAPCPRVRLTLTGLGASTVSVRITRTVSGMSLTVPGALSWDVVDSGVLVDFAAPLNLQTTYTLYVGGVIADVKTITLPSDDSWIQDPLQPDRSLPVKHKVLVPGFMTLDLEALREVDFPVRSSKMAVMGDPTPVAFGGQRSAESGINLTMHAPDAQTRDTFDLIKEAPVLLFRPAAKNIPLPSMSYLLANVKATYHGAADDDPFTTWAVGGDLVRAVLQQVISGFLSYDDVQVVLGDYTYDEVESLAGGTAYLDWQKNPLIFTTL